MSLLITDDDIAAMRPAEGLPALPIPMQVVSNGEFVPAPATARQRRVARIVQEIAAEEAPRQGLSRRGFLRSGAGLAAAFVALNEVHGPVFGVTRAEAAMPDMAAARAVRFAGQFVMDVHTHFLRDPLPPALRRFLNLRNLAGRQGWNPALAAAPATEMDLKFDNYVKEMFLDSDTAVAVLSGAPSDRPEDWFLTNQMKRDARARINGAAGTRRLLTQSVFTPGQPGWMDEVERTIEQDRPDAWKGYTIGDNTHQHQSAYPWRLDDERLMYPFYERIRRAGITTVAIHKGLFPPAAAQRNPRLEPFAGVADVAKAARDWPDIRFLIYHAAYRNSPPDQASALFEATGQMEWLTDLAAIPERYGVRNVWADVGAVFGGVVIANPRLAAGMIGTLAKGLGADRVLWGTDSVWYGSPQWQIEALRRLEMPPDLRRRLGLPELGEADGPLKSAILGGNAAEVYGVEPRRAALDQDGVAAIQRDYAARGGPARHRSLHAWGYVTPG
ncbi:MAG: amidohydrolase [Acetobacteraceae bacterium]|nr:amidohydrolase [Acetobacteraceae bacterium]